MGDYTIRLTASIGISIFPEHGSLPDVLVKNADIALFRAKENGKNNYKIYKNSFDFLASKRLKLESYLYNSFSSDKFELYYQPKVNLTTNLICGFEALLRLKDSKGEFISPSSFISSLSSIRSSFLSIISIWSLVSSSSSTVSVTA